MVSPSHERIRTVSPHVAAIRKMGYTVADMHIHTTWSDAAIGIPRLLNRAEQLGIGIAITDHEEIRGVALACDNARDILVIPGIEVSSREGPHILLYFYSLRDLADYYTTYVKAHRENRRWMATEKILNSAENYSCVKVAAHPFGYFGLNRGLLKCIDNGTLPPDIISHIDGIEVLCGGMGRGLNDRAADYAGGHNLPVTGGSDAHVLSAVGGVVTGVKAETPEGFLDGILAQKSIVAGQEANSLHKGMTAAVIAWSFVPYTVSLLQVRYVQTTVRMKRYLSDRFT